ncbi:uncharacterized protein CG4449 isoform X2 [Acyrthosiphon pisum]|uniref:Rad60/SUMO-like domain-containing protein n=1 Tax=Acyrthosiphon pisum TaxID=7029 RepID=A0A8R2FC89_ACYPI|nr:uncharacterized protein CG4449 isoform X2 [Acyrthosiphon pisum]|eukprot:XP_008188535.1 PREDICTED: uncharacterized protein CG4449 isoform X2 [Acyrthosiphon pisum]
MDLSDEDENPYDFVAQYKKLQMERKKKVADDKQQPIVINTINSQTETSVNVTQSSSKQCEALTNSVVNTTVNSTASTNDHGCNTQSHHQTKGNCATEESTNVVGPVICIGDFDDGYDMSLPKASKEKTTHEKMMEDAGNIMDNWKKKQIEEAEVEDALAAANRVMNVKVYWRQMRTYRFPLRMFQPISSIYEHFAKLENIDPSHVRLDLHKKTLSPTDTPNSINYKIVDFIDGEIEFYRSPYDTSNVVPEVKKPQDDLVKFCIKQKDVKKPIFIEIKKTDKMLILYIKLSEILGFDIDSFTLEFDGDKIKKTDTMDNLDLEGDECFELFQKQSKK